MPSLKDLRNRITSVKSTQKITKAMKMVAAAKLRKAQENAEKGRAYSEKMNNIIGNLKQSIADVSSAPKLLAGNDKSEIHLCIVITADRGLCGGFNTNIVKKAKEYFKNILDANKKLKIIIEDFINKNNSNDDAETTSEALLVKIENILDARLADLSPEDIKIIIQKMIKEHLGWLVVWGGFFGGLLGLLLSPIGLNVL